MSTTILKKIVAKYILAAITAWVPIGNQTAHGEDEIEAKARYEQTAEDIVDVTFDDTEPVIFRGDDGRLKSALELASIGSYEGGFQKFVDDGTCNKKEYKADGRGGCDGHTAFSIWQIHIFGNGYIIQGDELSSKMYMPDYAAEHPTEVIQGWDLIGNRQLAVRVALRLARTSHQQFHSLCRYTGEHCMEGQHPKADQRHKRAVDYLKAHPFVLPPQEELDLMEAEAEID